MNKMTGAPSKDSDQPWHLPSLIEPSLCTLRIAKDPMCLLADSEDWSDLVNAQTDLSSLGAQLILLVLSCCGSNLQIFNPQPTCECLLCVLNSYAVITLPCFRKNAKVFAELMCYVSVPDKCPHFHFSSAPRALKGANTVSISTFIRSRITFYRPKWIGEYEQISY